MGKLFCLIGKSGSGKDSIFKELIGDPEVLMSPVITYTTRPMRDNEKNGVEYNFITCGELINLKNAGKIIELRQYDTVQGKWFYCTVDDGRTDLKKSDYITIATLDGFMALKKRFGEKAVPIYINVDDGERLFRALKREKRQHNPNYTELCRRFVADSVDFSESRLKEAGIEVTFNNDSLSACVSKIKKFISDKKGLSN